MSNEKVKHSYKPYEWALLVLTAVIALIMIYPVLFAVMSAFKSNGEILKNPAAPPTSLYFRNFVDLFQMSNFGGAIINTVFLTVLSEALIICVVPMAAFAITRDHSRKSSFFYTFFISGMMIPFHLYVPALQGTEDVWNVRKLRGPDNDLHLRLHRLRNTALLLVPQGCTP